MTFVEFITDKNLAGHAIKDQATFKSWLVIAKVIDRAPLTAEELVVLKECTGLDQPPEDLSELFLIIGRRGGKSAFMALVACYFAVQDWRAFLAPGEHATIMVIAQDRAAARSIRDYAEGVLMNSPVLASLVEETKAESIHLKRRNRLEIHTASFRSTRGYSCPSIVADEVAVWRTDDNAKSPDVAILQALRPSQAQFGDKAILVVGSSPYAKKGSLWTAYKNHFGIQGRRFVWKASTRTMNPTISQAWIDEQMADDPVANRAELMAEFRDDLSDFVSVEDIEKITDFGVEVRPPEPGTKYFAFCDPSGGRADAMVLTIAHKDTASGRCVIDLVDEVKPPFSGADVVANFATIMRQYRVHTVYGDAYGAAWVEQAFSAEGIRYQNPKKNRSELYLHFLGVANSQNVRLIDHPRARAQFVNLQRSTTGSGRDVIDHPKGQNDDIANCIAGAVFAVLGRKIFVEEYTGASPCFAVHDDYYSSQSTGAGGHHRDGVIFVG